MKVSNTFIILITLCFLIGVIGYNVYEHQLNEHNRLLIYSLKSNAEYKAKRCYLEGVCKGETNLEYLYNKEYMTELVNPVSKEVIDKNTAVTYINDKIIIDWSF